ncbi:MAG: MATE family efflux transporter [Clostridium sp.]|nr:MATE family efflux transporter [Clostridium sp.]
MGTAFVQMAYSLTDMFWVGQNGSESVAAIGTAGFYVALSMAFIIISRVGGEVYVAQSIGRKDLQGAKHYAESAIQLNIFIGIIYGLFVLVFKDSLLGFFRIDNLNVLSMAKTYLTIMGIGMSFSFINPMFTGIFNGSGNSSTPFYINLLGLSLNMILDPILIRGLLFFPKLGVAGAALATIMSQILVTVSFLIVIHKRKEVYFKLNIFNKLDLSRIENISRVGIPVAIQSGGFTLIAMVIGRIVASYGPEAIAVQNIGAQIESLSWMTASGFSTAISTFVGQNFGAKKYDRVLDGFKSGIKIMSVVGIAVTLILYFFAKPLFSIFINEPKTIIMGVAYLQILAISQWFMTMEISCEGAFRGVSKTIYPSFISLTFNILRIPLALFLANNIGLGLTGVWWAISISTIFKGSILLGAFYFVIQKPFSIKIDEDKNINDEIYIEEKI